MTDPELVVIRTFLNPFAADVAHTALDAAGIESIVRHDDAGGTLRRLTGVDLLVRAEDAAAAAEVLAGATPVPED